MAQRTVKREKKGSTRNERRGRESEKNLSHENVWFKFVNVQ